MSSSNVITPIFMPCYHPIWSSTCYHRMLSSHVYLPVQVIIQVIIPCYHPMLSPHVFTSSYHTPAIHMNSSQGVTLDYQPMLSYQVITGSILVLLKTWVTRLLLTPTCTKKIDQPPLFSLWHAVKSWWLDNSTYLITAHHRDTLMYCISHFKFISFLFSSGPRSSN
jgi:hypothetical protein